MPTTPKHPVVKATPCLEGLKDHVDGDVVDTMPPTPKDHVSMATPYLQCSKADVDGDEQDEKEEEDPYEKPWSKEIQERFDSWFREWPYRPKGIDTCCFGEEIVEGMSLMEFFDVRVISHAKSRRKLNLNGRITVRGSYGERKIFARTRENPEKLYPKETLALTGPSIGTLGYDIVDIRLNLKDGNRQVCERELAWRMTSHGPEFYDCPRTVKVKGKNGFDFHVQYAVFQNANLITVGIELPKIINNGQSVLVKTVEAYVETAECRFPKTTLFNWKRNNVEVNSEGGELPLSKSLMTCPVGGTLVLDLFFRDCSDYSVKTERVKFVPRCFGREKMIVGSEYRSVIVNFTAYPIEVHPPTLAAAKFHYWYLDWPDFRKYL